MVRWAIAAMKVLVAVAFLASALPAPVVGAQDLPVLAFYYPWYNADDFSRSSMFDVPVSPYNSDDRTTMQRQVREASGAGISGFISSWMGVGNRTDRNFAQLLDVSKGTNFKSTVYFESGSIGSPQAAVDSLRYIMRTYGAHPNFARVAGKPAIFFWNPSAIGSLDTWRSIRDQVDPQGAWHWNVETDRPENWLDVFDGVHLFSAASWVGDASSTYRNLRSRVDTVSSQAGKPKLWAAGVAPGWDNSRQGTGTTVVVPRAGGSYYAARWDAATASNPDLITITSWSEWGEGTPIEPGTSYGNLYLDITRDKAAAYRGSAPPAVVSSLDTPAAPVGFRLGFKSLADQIPDVVGNPLEAEHYGPNGDSLQATSNGLMAWRKADNWTAFTNGSITWINGPYGIQSRTNSARFDWEAR
ncbi:MAG TPA: endo-1,3-alpha-glucanase family glycosylhydrolase [Chloroflexota bacterium]